MAEVPVGAIAAAPAVTVVPGNTPAPSARASKLAAVTAGLAKLNAAETSPSAAAGSDAAPSPAAPAAPTAPIEKPAEPKPAEEKPIEAPAADEPADPKTAKALAAIDKQAKRFRDEQATAKAELALERAELAKLKAEITGKASSFEELTALARKNPVALLEKLGLKSEDEIETIGRAILPFTKTGKAAPGAKEQAEKVLRERAVDSDVAELRKTVEAMQNEIKQRDAAAQGKAFVEQYLDAAIKAIPATPTLIGKLHEKAPARARATLQQIGARMEAEAMEADGAIKYDPSYTPSHADVIAEYEKLRRVELEEQGVDVDALLKPATAAAKPVRAATLDPTSPTGTRPVNGSPTSRADKLAAITAGLRKLDAAAT